MERKFKIGDTVKLKSGSPKMTINQYQGKTNMVECTWFVGNARLSESFHEDSLSGLTENINEKSSEKDLLLG